MKKILFCLVAAIACCITGTAQKVSIDNVVKPFTSRFGAIQQGTEVKGYYLFWASDKIDKKSYEWTLRITDPALKTLKEIKMQESKDITILETSFNGTDLIVLFYNDDSRTFDYQVYGADGKKKFSYLRQLTKKEERYLNATYLTNDDDNNYRGLYPIEGKGFISNTPSREDKDYTFQLDFFGTDKKKQWTYIPAMSGKKFIGDYLGTFNGIVYLEVLQYGSLLDGKPESLLVGLSLDNGKQLFARPTDGKYRFYPASMSAMTDGRAYIYGEYFDLNDNVIKDRSQGFAFWTVDEKGDVKTEKYLGWEQQLGKYIAVKTNGKIEDFGYMYLHNMIQTSNGDIYAIGEGFRKVASALGIMSKMVTRGGGISAIKIKVTDLILIHFDKDFNVKDAKIYEKNPNTLELSNGMEFVSGPLLGKMIKYNYDKFDYAYTQQNADASSFTVAYADYERGKDYKGSTFNAINYNDGKVTTDKIQTKSDASRSYVLPAEQGSVLILEVYKKDKKLEGHIEKLN